MRWAIGAGLVLAMLAFGIGVYHVAGALKGGAPVVHRPNEVSAPPLAGTMYVVQAGAIYRFHHGSFTQITAEAGWTQPSAAPDDQLVAVRLLLKYRKICAYSLDIETRGLVKGGLLCVPGQFGNTAHPTSSQLLSVCVWLLWPGK